MALALHTCVRQTGGQRDEAEFTPALFRPGQRRGSNPSRDLGPALGRGRFQRTRTVGTPQHAMLSSTQTRNPPDGTQSTGFHPYAGELDLPPEQIHARLYFFATAKYSMCCKLDHPSGRVSIILPDGFCSKNFAVPIKVVAIKLHRNPLAHRPRKR